MIKVLWQSWHVERAGGQGSCRRSCRVGEAFSGDDSGDQDIAVGNYELNLGSDRALV